MSDLHPLALNNSTALLEVSRATAIDGRMIDSGRTSPTELMKRAGTAVADEIRLRWKVGRVTVLCGPGNNGGDGFVAARALASEGWTVRVALLGTRDALTPAALFHSQRWHGPIEPMTPEALSDAELVIDAVFGTGLKQAVIGPARDTLLAASRLNLSIVSIDIPSGIMGDTGEDLGAVPAVLTVTFIRKKPGHLLFPGRSFCGEIRVADLGSTEGDLEQIGVATYENDPGLWLGHLPQLQRVGNKYTRGHALISGGYPLTGAARSAAHAAARSGAGLTTIAIPAHAMAIYSATLTCIMVHPLVATDDFGDLLSTKRFSGFLIGPGSGDDDITRDRVLHLLKTKRPVVLDADALSTFRYRPEILFDAIQGPCVMTPHEGEFKRLFDPAGDKLTRARAAARRSGAIVVLKGADTVIANPDGRAIINSNAPATLATAGAGDVLSGIILGLLAQGMDPFMASASAVWIHGAAAGRFGSGLIADDLPNLLPAVFSKLFQENQALSVF